VTPPTMEEKKRKGKSRGATGSVKGLATSKEITI